MSYSKRNMYLLNLKSILISKCLDFSGLQVIIVFKSQYKKQHSCFTQITTSNKIVNIITFYITYHFISNALKILILVTKFYNYYFYTPLIMDLNKAQ